MTDKHIEVLGNWQKKQFFLVIRRRLELFVDVWSYVSMFGVMCRRLEGYTTT